MDNVSVECYCANLRSSDQIDPCTQKSQAWYTSGTPAQEGSDPACLVKVVSSRFSQRPCHKTKVNSERSKAQDLHMLTHRQVHTQTHIHTHTHTLLHTQRRCILRDVSDDFCQCVKNHTMLYHLNLTYH